MTPMKANNCYMTTMSTDTRNKSDPNDSHKKNIHCYSVANKNGWRTQFPCLIVTGLSVIQDSPLTITSVDRTNTKKPDNVW